MTKKSQKTIFFYDKNIDIKKYLKKNENIIKTIDQLKKVKKLDWVFYNQSLMTQNNYKNYTDLLYKKKIKTFSFINFKKPNILNKDILHQNIKKEYPNEFNKYFMNQIKIKNNNSIKKFKSKTDIYIVKPNPGYSGHGIKIFNKKDEIKNYINNFEFNKNNKNILKLNKPKKWIIQEYINDPLLLNKKKFHLRVLVLIYYKNNKKYLYLFNKYIPICAKKNYLKSNYNNQNIHNTHWKDYNETDIINFMKDFYKTYDVKLFESQIIEICKLIKPNINGNCYENTKNCFHFLGLDLMINKKLELKLIEINQRPGTLAFYLSNIKDILWSGLLDITLYNKTKAKDFLNIEDIEYTVTLDKITLNNKNDLQELVSNYNVMKYVGSREVWSSEKTNKFINYCIKEEHNNNKTTIFLKILVNNKFAGIIGIHKYDKSEKDFELTYYIKKIYQSRGIGSQALLLMLEKFHKMYPKVKRVLSDTLSNNIGAQKSLIKNGFMFIKKVRRSKREYFRYEYVFKFDKILSKQYPYLKYFMKKSECLERFEELKKLKFDQLKSKNYNNNLLIKIDYNIDKKYNRITDYFTNQCRMNCIFKGNISPYEYYQKNKGIILKNSLVKNNFNYDKFEEYMYTNGNMCNNFQVSIIMNIYNYFKPKKILDSSAGWGDRLVSAIAYSQSNKNKTSYIGIDPSKCLKPLYEKIIKTLNKETRKRKNLFRVINKPFEKITKKDINEKFDLAFTSPPFWDLEVYENNKNQSIMGYNNEKNWTNGFLNKLAQLNIDYLESGGHFVIYVPRYTEFMTYMDSNKEVKYLGSINFQTSSKSKLREILVWKKL